MKAFVVGGAVRDQLLGSPVHDRDWVVVGATPQQMLDAGYTPVGRDFPVFLHPQTHEQYALARTERKAAPGYHGFVFHAAPDVTLEQDLARRDLTINAMAIDDGGELIDPFDGRADLEAGLLRHVSDAFAEDPVRLLRVARFAARWPRFRVADDTGALLRRLVASGEVDALVPERVWQELSRGLAEAQPSRMIAVLRDAGALARLAPALDAWLGSHAAVLPVVDAAQAEPVAIRFACLCHALDARADASAPTDLPQLQALCERWRVDTDTRALALLVAREWPTLVAADPPFDAEACLSLLERADALRRPARWAHALVCFAALAPLLPGSIAAALRQRRAGLERALSAAQAVTTQSLPPDARAASGEAIGRALRAARLDAIARVLRSG